MARLSAVVLALAAPAGALVAPAAPKATVKVQGVSDMIGGTTETAGLWDPLRLSDGASDGSSTAGGAWSSNTAAAPWPRRWATSTTTSS